jgi:hypothetical protein
MQGRQQQLRRVLPLEDYACLMEAIRGNQRQSETIRGHQRPSEAIRGLCVPAR